MADLYADKEGQANAIKLKLLKAREMWKGKDLEAKAQMQTLEFTNRKEARNESAKAVLELSNKQGDDAAKEKLAQREHDDKVLDQQHKNDMAKMTQQENFAMEHEESA